MLAKYGVGSEHDEREKCSLTWLLTVLKVLRVLITYKQNVILSDPKI